MIQSLVNVVWNLLVHRQELLKRIVTSKFQTTLPYIHIKRNLQDTHSHTHTEKITVCEIQNTHTHTHTHIYTHTHNDKNISNINEG